MANLHGAVWAHEVAYCLEGMYTSATPILLCVVGCQSDLYIGDEIWKPEPLQIPIFEFWKSDCVHQCTGSWQCHTTGMNPDSRHIHAPATSAQIASVIEKYIFPPQWSGVSPVNSPTPIERDGPVVVVVGAGVAGLTVARRLILAGFHVRVLERSSKVGGVWRHQANGAIS